MPEPNQPESRKVVVEITREGITITFQGKSRHEDLDEMRLCGIPHPIAGELILSNPGPALVRPRGEAPPDPTQPRHLRLTDEEWK